MTRALVVLLLLGLGALGCGEVEVACDDPVACTCGPARALPDGACCPPWTVAEPGGVCRGRAWTFPAPGQTSGGPAAARVSASIDSAGRAIFVWEQAGAAPGSRVVVIGEEGSDGSLALRMPSLALPGFAAAPTVAAGAAGDAVVAWWQVTGASTGHVYRSERAVDGAWIDPASEAEHVSFGEKGHESHLAASRSGEIVHAWNQWYDGEHYGIAIQRRAGPDAAWEGAASEKDVVSPPSFFSNAPQVAVNARGDAIVSWYQSPGTDLMTFASERWGKTGTFSRPGVSDFLSAKGAPVDSDDVANPKPALAEDGRSVVVWTQESGQGGLAVYLASRDASGAWTRPADLSDSLSRRDSTCRDVHAAFDSLGFLYVVWSEDVGAGHIVKLAQRAPDGAWIHPGDEPLVLSSKGAVQAITPVIATDRDGGVIVAWSEQIGELFQVTARRGSAAGFGLLEVLSPAGEDAFTPYVTLGGPGDRAVVAWIQGDPSVARVLAATLD
ncbi:hypothetical protein [Polyangium sp. 6x1]|uniref:hypothetical protein n=1 Tax=Polyangium sp. 6x1 TaxID=3042689 RepID=UPI002482B380|nr:hypothetical protein [Polyangium sp. 6x1]MDI1443902.1 hypothetical protein [Polyangium sp. 6x1]